MKTNLSRKEMDQNKKENDTVMEPYIAMDDEYLSRIDANVVGDISDSDDDDDDDDEAPMLVRMEEDDEVGPLRDEPTQPIGSLEKDKPDEDTVEDDIDMLLPPCPVTILSGFLGAGKTTLIQYILRSPDHGKRIAVIENEFGGGGDNGGNDDGGGDVVSNGQKEGIAVESMIARDGAQNLTDLIELPNGCVCCTVKDNLVLTLEKLLTKRKDLDYILIEASGMANPGPIAALFWLDDALESRLRLDGVVTIVDGKNLLQQLVETEEAAQQIAYADRVLLNKVDLVSESEKESVTDAIRRIHPTAAIRETSYSAVPDLDWILDAHCFDVDRAQSVHEALAVSVSVSVSDSTGVPVSAQEDGRHGVGDMCMDVSCVACERNRKSVRKRSKAGMVEQVQPLPMEYCVPISDGGTITTTINTFTSSSTSSSVDPSVTMAVGPFPLSGNKSHIVSNHRHTSAVGTVALTRVGSVSLRRLNAWLADLLWPDQDEKDEVLRARLEASMAGEVTSHRPLRESTTTQLYRIKGIVSVMHDTESVPDDGNQLENDSKNDNCKKGDGEDGGDVECYVDEEGRDVRRFVVQAVHDLWEIHPAGDDLRWDRVQPGETVVSPHSCKVVLIGRNLDRERLEGGFTACFVAEPL